MCTEGLLDRRELSDLAVGCEAYGWHDGRLADTSLIMEGDALEDVEDGRYDTALFPKFRQAVDLHTVKRMPPRAERDFTIWCNMAYVVSPPRPDYGADLMVATSSPYCDLS